MTVAAELTSADDVPPGLGVDVDLSNACAGMLTGVTVLNNWIRQGVVRRGLVVSGEYISQLGFNAARHIRIIMSKELACLTLRDAGAALLLERADGLGRDQPGRLHHHRRPQPARPCDHASDLGAGEDENAHTPHRSPRLCSRRWRASRRRACS